MKGEKGEGGKGERGKAGRRSYVANAFCSGQKERIREIMRLHVVLLRMVSVVAGKERHTEIMRLQMLLLKAEIEEATLTRKVRLKIVLL